MSFDSNSTQSSYEEWTELSALTQNPERSENGSSPENCSLTDLSQAFFIQYFPESQNSGVEFFSFSDYTEHSRIRLFRYKQNMYALAAPNLVRAVVLEVIEKAERERVENLYMVLNCRPEKLMNMFRMLVCVGFKQVKPRLQRFICTAPGVVVLFMKVN